MTLPTLRPGQHITGPTRTEAAQHAANLYAAGCSIRSVAEQLGRSYGFTHGLLIESGVPMRGRNGRARKAAE